MQAHSLTLVVPHQQSGFPYPWLFFGMTAVLLIGVLVLSILLLRRAYGRAGSTNASDKDPIPRVENAPAFMTASMQAVILKLREQEKELERLHRAERERAENTERLSEEVTRNMPAGLLLVNASGIISSANPAAEQTLGMRGLAFRRFSEALGETSGLTRLLSECLASGKVFRREEVRHVTPGGDVRLLGI